MESNSGKRQKSLKTHIASKLTTKPTAALKKSGGKSSEKPKKAKPSSLSLQKKSKDQSDLLVQDALQSVKKRSIEDRKQGGDGWVRAIPEEQKGFNILASKLRTAMGRPRKDPKGIAKVRALRLSDEEMKKIQNNAKEAGFVSWREYARSKLLDSSDKAV